MAKDPREPAATVIDLMTRAAIDAAAGMNYADKIYIGSRLLAVVVLAAKALGEMDSANPNAVIVDEHVREAADALQDVGATLRSHVRFPTS